MEQNRQNAYCHLLYWAMLDIRLLAVFRLRWWNPVGILRDLRYVRYCGRLAYCLHNLARDVAYDDVVINKDFFWSFLGELDAEFPGYEPARLYRDRFERRLEQLNSTH